MAKTIKFNLRCDGQQVRNLDDLRNYFSIDDVLQYYHDKILEKWLFVRGYTQEYNAVLSLANEHKDEDIIRKIIKILNVEIDESDINYSVSIIKYRKEREQIIKGFEKGEEELGHYYKDYFDGYNSLVDSILHNPKNKGHIQACISTIVEQYQLILNSDYRNLFYKLKDVSLLAIMCLLMNPETRKYYLLENVSELGESSIRYKDAKEMSEWINGIISETTDFSEFGEHFKTHFSNTDGYQRNLSKGKCLILKIGNECKITEDKEDSPLRSSNDVNFKFPIFESLNYSSEKYYISNGLKKYISVFYIEI